MSAVGRTFTKLRNQVAALDQLCARLDAGKAPVGLVDVVEQHRLVVEDVIASVGAVQLALQDLATAAPVSTEEPACFTYRSGDQTFQHVPADLRVERLDAGRYRITNLVAGQSYLEAPPRFVALGNECNDRAFSTAIVWTPSMTADSFEVWFMYNGSRYDGNYGGSAPLDFITFLLYPRLAATA